MITYILYNTIFLGCFVNSYLAEKLDSKYSRLLCRTIVFLLLTIPSSLRYFTGTDYGAYLKMFYNHSLLERTEIFWKYLYYLIVYLGLPAQFIFVFSSILIYFPICFILKRKYFCLSIVLYIILGYYFKSFNILRQMIAVSFIVYGLLEFESRKYLKALFLYLIAIGFHSASLIVIPCFLISFVKLCGKKLPFIFLLLCIIFCIYFNCLKIILSILSLVGSKFARYASSGFFTGKTALGSGIGVFSRLLFSLLAVFYYKRISEKHTEKINALNFSFIYIIVYILAAQFVILGRLRDFFLFAPFLITGFAFESCGKYKKIVMIMFLALNILLFEADIKKQNRDSFSNGIYPYYSIFYEGVIK